MPERILRDVTDSEPYNNLSVHARDLFIRLLCKVDDYGCYHGNLKIIRSLLYPLLVDETPERDIDRWLIELAKLDMVERYEDGGKSFLWIVKFGKQRLRNKKNKFPLPKRHYFYKNEDNGQKMSDKCQTDVRQMSDRCQTSVRQMSDKCQTDVRHPPSDTDTETETDADADAETDADTEINTNTADVSAKRGLRKKTKKPKPQKPVKETNPNHAAFIDGFVQRWSDRHEGGKYPFAAGRDARAASEILKSVNNDLDRALLIVDAYMTDDDRYVAGHPLSKLPGLVAKYAAEVVNFTPKVKFVLTEEMMRDWQEIDREVGAG